MDSPIDPSAPPFERVPVDLLHLPALIETAEKRGVQNQPFSTRIRCHVAESRARFQTRSARLGEYKTEMTRLHRQARTKLDDRQTAEWDGETRARAERVPKGLRGLWHRITGKYQEVRRQNEAEARLTLLAPDIVEAILDGRHDACLQRQTPLRGLPREWEKQREMITLS